MAVHDALQEIPSGLLKEGCEQALFEGLLIQCRC